MRLRIVCVGSRGDVIPFVALGRGLAAAGYSVGLVTHEAFRPVVEAHGLAFRPLTGNPRELMERARARAVLASGRNVFSFVRHLTGLWREFAGPFLASVERGCQDAQAIVFSTLGFPAWHVAQSLRVPAIAGFLQPQTRTRAFPAPGFPAPGPLRRIGAYNRATYALLELQAWWLVRGVINRWRRTSLGLPPLPLSGSYPEIYGGALPILYGMSPALVPRPPDWPPNVHVTGTWHLPGGGAPPPGEALRAFLRDGPPPVYVGFGSMRGADPERMARVAMDALGRLGRRGILCTGWSGLRPGTVPDSVAVADEVAHDDVFPHVAAVVHHGGAGTTAAGLRAGRPTVVVPFLADQFFWGERVHRLGAGPPPVPARRLTAGRLARAIGRALGEPAIGARAEALGDALRAEDGVGTAVRIVGEILGSERGREPARPC